jgi:hypothetical protein
MANNDNLRRFGAYVKALELFDHVVADLTPLMNNPALHRAGFPAVCERRFSRLDH